MKYKNYGFWTSLAASLVVVAGMLQKALGFEISSEILTDIVMGIAGVLVVFGVVKMPKEKTEQDDSLLEETEEDTDKEEE